MPFDSFKVPPDMAIDIVNGIDRLENFKNLINPVILKMNIADKFFIKLITRSPKDYLDDDLKITSAEQAYNALCCSLRTAEDLCMLSNIDMCYVIIRPFVPIAKHEEFRVFVYGRKIVGISQYHYHEDIKIHNAISKEKAIRKFINKKVTPNLKLNHFVADVYFDKFKEPVLIELNPFGLSDPCLFESYYNIDGSFKYNK